MRATRMRPRTPSSFRPLRLKARDVMTPFPETVRQGASVQEAAARMRAFDLGCLPVMDGDQLVGVVTDRDLVTRAVGGGLDPRRTPVGDIMTTDLISCDPNASIDSVMRSMAILQIRRMLVIGGGRTLLGVIGLENIVRAGYRSLSALVLGILSRPFPELPPPMKEL